MSMRLFIWCDCDIAVTLVCVMLLMNGLHTHSVQLRCVIPIYISETAVAPCEETDLNRKKELSQNSISKENKSHCVNEP